MKSIGISNQLVVVIALAGCAQSPGDDQLASVEESLLPLGNQRVFGAYTADYFGESGGDIDVAQFESDVGKTIAIEPRRIIIKGDHANPPGFAGDVRDWADDARRRGRTPLIVWNLFSNTREATNEEVLCSDPDYAALKVKFSARAIRYGLLDAYIDRFATEVAAWGGEILVRPMHETNVVEDIDTRGPCGTGFVRPQAAILKVDGVVKSNLADYREAWRRVVQRFRDRGANNARFVLSFTSKKPGLGAAYVPVSQAYPGDEWLFWNGVDCYNACYDSTALQATYDEFTAVGSTLPFFLGEFGVAGTVAQTKAAKITELLDATKATSFYRRFPRFKGFMYWNQFKREGHNHFAIHPLPPSIDMSAVNAFRQAIASPIYRGAMPIVGAAAWFYQSDGKRQDFGDWDPGHYQGNCASNEAVSGISLDSSARYEGAVLCTEQYLAAGSRRTVTSPATAATLTHAGDWDPNTYKLECAPGEYVLGASQTKPVNFGITNFHGVLCAAGSLTNGGLNACQVREITTGYTPEYGDWAPLPQLKMNCSPGKVVVGISYSVNRNVVHRILCCDR